MDRMLETAQRMMWEAVQREMGEYPQPISEKRQLVGRGAGPHLPGFDWPPDLLVSHVQDSQWKNWELNKKLLLLLRKKDQIQLDYGGTERGFCWEKSPHSALEQSLWRLRIRDPLI